MSKYIKIYQKYSFLLRLLQFIVGYPLFFQQKYYTTYNEIHFALVN